MRPTGADRQTGAGFSVAEAGQQRRALGQRRHSLEAVGAVVAAEHRRCGAGKAALQMSPEQLVRFLLVVRDLQSLRELDPVLLWLDRSTHAAGTRQRQARGGDLSDHDGGNNEPDRRCPFRARLGRANLSPALFRRQQASELVAYGLVSGLQAGGQARLRARHHQDRHHEASHRGPTRGKESHIFPLCGGVVGMELLQNAQFAVNRGDQLGVQLPGQLGPPCRVAGEQRLLTDRVSGIHAPGDLRRCGKGHNFIARNQFARVGGRSHPHDADHTDPSNRQREEDAQTDQRHRRALGKASHGTSIDR